MSTSILNDVKHNLGLFPEDDTFDQSLLIYINTAFGTLTQLGVGPAPGYEIENAENTWDEFFTDPRLNATKSYVYLLVKMLFDPPEMGFLVTAMKEQLTEMGMRLNWVADYG